MPDGRIPARALMRTEPEWELFWAALARRPRLALSVWRRDLPALAEAARLDPMTLPLDPAKAAAAQGATVTGDAAGLGAALAARVGAAHDPGPDRPVPHPPRPADALRALRPHQWVKNVLLLVPLVAAHLSAPGPWAMALLAMAGFSLTASSIYVLNDLLDLSADRAHPTKRHRPFAAGDVGLRAGMVLGLGCFCGGMALAALAGWDVLLVAALYAATSAGYSLGLKRLRWVDLAVLASLYILRIVAGAWAADVPASGWLIAFLFPVFLMLAAVKRLTELAKSTKQGRLPGRGYGARDRMDLRNIAVLATCASMAVFAGYVASDTAATLYDSQGLLALAALGIAGWQVRMIVTGAAGRQDYDPMVFALVDPKGLALVGLTLLCLLAAI